MAKKSSSQKDQKTVGTSQGARKSSSNTGSTMPQNQQNASAQPTGQYQQQGHGHGQAHLATGGQYGQPVATHGISLGGKTVQSATSAPGQQTPYPQDLKWRHASTGGQYGQPAATQHVQVQSLGSSLGGNTTQSATSALGQQTRYPQEFKWRHASTPVNQQGAMGQGGPSATSAPGLGAGAGAYGSTFSMDPFRPQSGMPPSRGTRGAKPSRGQRG